MSDQNESHKQAADAVRNFFKDPRLAESVIDVVVRKRPVGWSKRSNAPYYTEFHGKQMKSVADKMIASTDDQMFFYHDYENISHNTLYLRVNQSLRALVDFCDGADGKYSNWSNMVRITREKSGVRISLKPEFKPDNGDKFIVRSVGDKSAPPSWQTRIDEYLESDIAKPLLIDKLMLSPQEITDTKASLAGVKGILFSVKASEIRIVKTS